MVTTDNSLRPGHGPLARRGARDIAYAELRRQIVSGELKPGVCVSEIELAARLGLSRTPLRESVKALETQGFMTRLPNGRLMVTPLRVRDLLDLFATRLAIERLIVESVVTEATDREIEDALGPIAAAIRNNLEVAPPEARHFGEQFHYALTEISPNRVAATILWELRDRIALYRKIGPDRSPERRIQAARDHLRIYELVRTRQLEAAIRAMEEHIRGGQVVA
ncbi:MAG: GntR family transcriptional regulator, partial [Chloroflexota bacterium]